MTPLHLAGLILILALNAGIGICIRFYSVRHWNGPAGVFYRESTGLALVFCCAAAYRWIFHPPFDGLLIIPLLALEILLIVLYFEREEILPYQGWEGIQDGKLSYKAICSIEDLIATILEIQDLQRQAERFLQEQERSTAQAMLQLGDLRFMRDTLSVKQWRERVDEYLGRMRGGE